MTLVQIDGLSGTGKTTLSVELRRRGFSAVDADRAFAYYADPVTGLPTAVEVRANWKWDGPSLRAFADHVRDERVFVCGGALNGEEFLDLFQLRFVLLVDDATLRHRILSRTNNDFGKDPEELAEQLDLNTRGPREATARGAVPVDAGRPVEEVADDILRLTNAALGSPPQPLDEYYDGLWKGVAGLSVEERRYRATPDRGAVAGRGVAAEVGSSG